MNKSNLYISKKCPHCRRILLLLRDRHDLTPSLNIIPIEDYQYPQYIKSVPSMVVNDSIWNAERIFSFIEQSGRQQQQQMGQQQKDMKEKEISGFCLDSGSCSLSFASFGDETNPVDFDRYSGISDKNDSTPQSSTNDNFVEKDKRSNEFDSKYENMLSERNDIH